MSRLYLPPPYVVLYSLLLVSHILILNQIPPPPPQEEIKVNLCVFFKLRVRNFTKRHRHRRVFEEFSKTTAKRTREHNNGKSDSATKERILRQQYSNCRRNDRCEYQQYQASYIHVGQIDIYWNSSRVRWLKANELTFRDPMSNLVIREMCNWDKQPNS